MKHSKSKKNGFTLVELIVVLTILTILAALLIPALTGYIEKAKKDKVIAETRMLHKAVQTITSELYAGSTQWKASNGAITLASSSGNTTPFSSGLAGVNLKDSYNETVKLSEVPSLQDGSGHFLAIINGNGKVHSIIYSARGYLGLYSSDTKQYEAYKIGEKTAYGTVNDDFYSNGYYSSIYYNAAIDEGNSNDLFVSIAWSCAGIRFTLEVGESPYN
ncbi:type II secretion system protein [Ruminococcus sp. OM08-13AT]|nr:type II secretion system protein [Ruminococcus sp. OM08-13AT]RGI54722.1 type II secretion system protein [Ruminococcus sp. OF05-2BH]